jgi:mannose-6-phosphate isomerase
LSSPLPKKIEKPWGYEILWAHTGQYVGKILFVRAGESLSLQYHKEKEETLFIESGECIIHTGPEETKLSAHKFHPGDTFHITPGKLHQIEAVTDCRIFEVSTPQLDDVVRLKDRYGR